jgi:thiopeptide-type bacteriocin biosynthesis protein
MAARYRHCGIVLARSTTDPGDLDIPRYLDPADDDGILGEGRAWLEKLWARDDARDALTLASPALCERVSGLLAGDPGQAAIQDLRRAVLSVASYMLRWQGRVTPFGLFAGILPVTTGPAVAAIGTRHRAVARADCEWVAALTAGLGQVPGLRPALEVIASNLAFVRDGRLVLPRPAGPGTPGTTAVPVPAREASVRWTPPVQAAIEIAATAVRVADLTARLASRFRTAGRDAVSTLVNGLIDGGFLITSLDPPMTAGDPLACVTAALREADAAGAAGLAPRLHALEQVSGQILVSSRCGDPEESARLRGAVAARMRALAPAPRHPLAVDVRLDGHVTLPEAVLDEAATAAGVLLRLTTRPFGSPAWLDYHARFRERYGPGAVISVRDLIADSGLGFPDGYLGTPRQRPLWRMLTDRDAAFLALIQQAALAGSEEIRLTDADIQALTSGDETAVVAPQRAEIGVSLHARSATAIDRGDFEIRVVAVPRAPTSMAGRFAHLLTAAERDQLAATFQAGDGSLAVQLSFPPRRPRAANVARVPPLAADVIALGEHPAGGTATVSVDDLAVTADATQMYLVHQPDGRRVVPVIPHALELTVLTPPLARFIAEVADARTARLGPLDLGAARALPYVPRIRWRRAILSPARWLLTPGDLAPGPGEASGRESQLDRWRDRWKVPARVVACDGERRLPLDLDHALDRALLHRQLEQASQLELHEDTPPGGDGWLGRPAELLIPLTLAKPASRPLPVMAGPGRRHRPGTTGVLCAHLAGSPARFDDIIAGHLPALMDRLGGQAERWWLRRHRDMIHPGAPQHIAVLIRLRDPDGFAAAAAGLAGLATGLEARGLPGQLTLATYHEHPARYGEGAAMAAAERVFAADTAAAIAQIAMATAAGVPGQALAAASMARIAAAFAPDPVAGYQAITRCLGQGSGALDRILRGQACDLADPAGGFQVLRALPGGVAVAEAWGRRDAALAAYHEELSAQRDPGTVLRTLLHEHHMRAVGLDPDFERQTGRLARAAALRRIALAGRA